MYSQIYQPMVREVMETDITLSLGDTNGQLKVRFRDTNGSNVGSKTIQVSSLGLELTPESDEQVIPTSVRFKLGGLTYIDRNGSLIHSVDDDTNSGTNGGSVSYVTGKVTISEWIGGSVNSITNQSLVTKLNAPPINKVTFRTSMFPLRNGSLQVIGTTTSGDQINVTADSNGDINSSIAKGYVDYNSGVATIFFGTEVIIDTNNRPSIESQDWYDPSLEYIDGSDTKIFQPVWVESGSLTYNAVAYSYLPLDASILGLDPVRLPSDGKVPVFRVGDVAVLHKQFTSVLSNSISVSDTHNVGESRIANATLVDSSGTEIPVNMYSVNKIAGSITILPDWDVSGYNLPIIANVRVEDVVQITDAQINGDLKFNRSVTHSYPVGSSVSSALLCNNLVSRLYNLFTQESWTGVWSESMIGNDTNAEYNDILSPMVVTNEGTIKERWAIIFTSNTSFRLVGENVGQIATGDINSQFAPINPSNSKPYFTINPLGWGTGWVAGNVVRFNTDAASYPMWLIRTIKQGVPTIEYDDFEIQIRGDRNRV